MDFSDTPEEAAFRAEVRAFLEANAEPKSETRTVYPVSYGSLDMLPLAREWQRKKAEAGLVGLSWPKQYGGRALPQIYQVIFDQEQSNYLVPHSVFDIGLGMCIPTMMTFATEEQKTRFVGPAVRGEEIWCQLFSEPAAGSDVAALQTRSVKDGDDWVINGQKIWTSGAHFSDWGVLVTRSDPSLPKHKGLTFFFLNMKSPGITIKPIRQISDSSNFNEVFFTDVRIPDAQRLGAVGDGWKVAVATLMNERLAVGESREPNFADLFRLCRQLELEDGPALRNALIRDKLADWYVQQQGMRFTRFRTMTALSRGQTPGPESSMLKIVNANKRQAIARFGSELLEMTGSLVDPGLSPLKAVMQQALLDAPGTRIGGGTEEILRTVIAERVLGMPAEIRVDKDIPFKDLAKQ
ncbi:acyl-CoA dehydrogenase family protein [Ferrovibrio sp.]|uniref:acyl-CoA dehydrogenase family protein n=1 Tax=Ferrovibrio sp. TaxID=1917215 RepID=UPI000CB97312|nr:acyl-CoA dehydrogenase family protein [Ferrovibrio sp.]PJI42220.1 MAG: acyl-CoA dehydrogenase [Ferrovibrio sp.]